MQFTYRNPDRSTDPGRALEGARSLVVGARRYSRRGAGERRRRAARAGCGLRPRRSLPGTDGELAGDRRPSPRARLAGAGARRHELARRPCSRVPCGPRLVRQEQQPADARSRQLVRHSAQSSRPRRSIADESPVEDGCGACHRCLTGCPTGAIIAPGIVDARRCLAWLLQTSGDFPREHRVALGDRIYGCDDCQEVCPHNLPTRRDRATGCRARCPSSTLLPRRRCRRCSPDHGRWYIAERDPRYLRRNALVVLGNVGDPNDAATRDDPAALSRRPRSDAALACRVGGPPARSHDLLATRAADPVVADELAAPAPASP